MGLMVSEKKILKKKSRYKSMETLDPRSGASLDPKRMVGRIYVETKRICKILNTLLKIFKGTHDYTP